MDIVSIAPATKTVALGSAAVEVSGLSLGKLAQVVRDYPQLVGFASGGKLDVGALLERGPEMALALFVAGLVGPAKPKRFWFGGVEWVKSDIDALIAAFDAAAAGQQIDILSVIVDLTFKGERGAPFLASVIAALASENQKPEDRTKEPEMTTPDASTGASSSD